MSVSIRCVWWYSGRALRLTAVSLAACSLLVLGGCGGDDKPAGEASGAKPEAGVEDPPPDALRVIVRPEPVAALPREAKPVSLNRDLAYAFAESLGRPPYFIPVSDYTTMIDRLIAGEADVVASGMTVTEARKQRVIFSAPYAYVDELLVLRRDGPAVESLEDLAGLDICVREGTSYEETLTALQESSEGLAFRTLPGTTGTEEVIEAVARGECQATVADESYWLSLEPVFEELHSPLVVTENRPIALAFRPEDERLRRLATDHIVARELSRHRDREYTEDLPGIRERGRLRMITSNSPTSYYLHRGRERGFEYELVNRFAASQELELDVVVPQAHEDLLDWLLSGKGDVVAANLTITDRRDETVAFTRPYMEVDQLVVVAADGPDLETLADLAGMTLHVRKSSAYYDTLTQLEGLPEDVEIAFAPEEMDTDSIIARVEEGEWQATVADSHIFDAEILFGRKIKAPLSLQVSSSIAWAVRPGDTELLAALNAYIRREHRGLHYNIWKQREFEDEQRIREARGEWRSDTEGRISPYDDLARKYGAKYGLDWRLLVAVMLQESQFQPRRVSPAGAKGLMQMVPRTAREVGVQDLFDPEQAIAGGTRYLDQLMERFPKDLPLASRIRFALASYNAGYGHVSDARRLARHNGLDPDRWYGHVEQAMLWKQQPKYYRKTRFGYCRGSETVGYVSNIDRYYQTFLDLVSDR